MLTTLCKNLDLKDIVAYTFANSSPYHNQDINLTYLTKSITYLPEDWKTSFSKASLMATELTFPAG